MTKSVHIEAIRDEYRGLRDLPRESLASSVKTLADDLYNKKMHFIFELTQNAEDNDYGQGVHPSLEFEISEQELEGWRGPVLIVHNNECGFQEKHVRALCQVGKSTKQKAQGYIGEKGIGFKSVFSITTSPYIFSNGYQFCLPEKDEETGLGYIVPRWVPRPHPCAAAAETTIMLPIKDEKSVKDVVDGLRDIAPETLLFLDKLDSIHVYVHLPEDEHEVMVERRVILKAGNSRLVELTHLKRSGSVEEVETSQYWLTEIDYARPADVSHEKRAGIDSRPVSVAIPLTPSARRDKLFAYLPVWEETGVPFLINADFLLVSSREGVREDESWNKWLRSCLVDTYCQSFVSLLSCSAIPVETRVLAYASIPRASSRPFLTPIIAPVQQQLREQECVHVLPDDAMVAPAQARLAYRNVRVVLEPAGRYPSYLRTEIRFVRPDMEPFAEELKAIGVKLYSLSEFVACLRDTPWVQDHPVGWYLQLYRYLQSQKFNPDDLRQVSIVPIGSGRGDTLELSCDNEIPIFFSHSEEDEAIRASMPAWLSDLVPIAFLDAELLELLDGQSDAAALRAWMTAVLVVCEFSTGKYCTDIRWALDDGYESMDGGRLIEATQFLARHAKADFDWEPLPVVLSDGRRMLLSAARKAGTRLVVPETLFPGNGWQHIWVTTQDRSHFVALASGYSVLPPAWFDQRKISRYPGFAAVTYGPSPYGDCPLDIPERELLSECYYAAASYYRGQTRVYSSQVPSTLAQGKQSPPISPALARALLGLMASMDVPDEDYWGRERLHTLGLYAKGVFQYRGPNERYGDSAVLASLRKLPWLPASTGCVSPPDAFLARQDIKEIFADTVPYCEAKLPDKTLRLLRVRSEITTDELVSMLEERSGNVDANLDLVQRIYSQLAARTQSSADQIRKQFSDKALILTKDSASRMRWWKSGDCVWEDAFAAFGDNFAYLAGHYPKLREFFVDRLSVKARVDSESFAKRWLALQDAPIHDPEQQRSLVARLYREIRPIALAQPSSRSAWWTETSKKLKAYTQSDKFERPAAVVLPDDGSLREIFRGEVEFAWRPDGDGFNDWAGFYRVLGTPFLSTLVSEHIEDTGQYETQTHKRYLTESAVKMIAAWMREKRKDEYERLLKADGFHHLAIIQEALISADVEVEFRLRVDGTGHSVRRSWPIFWDRTKNVLLYRVGAKDSDVAKTIARGIMPNQDYKDLAHWVELVLGATDTDRLRDEGWSVPQEILDLYPKRPTGREAAEATAEAGRLEAPALATHTAEPPASQVPGSAGAAAVQKPDGPGSPSASAPRTGELRTPQQTEPDGRAADRAGQLGLPQSTPAASQEEGHREVSGQGSGGTGGGTRSNGAPPTTQTPGTASVPARPPAAAGQPTNLADTSDAAAFDYQRELRDAFSREGVTHFDGEDEPWEEMVEGHTVRHPERRQERLAADIRDALTHEPSAEERRRVVERSLLEGPNPEVRSSLLDWYQGRCQICQETWPKQDGEPYFTAAYLVERKHAAWIDRPGNAICLCAEHFVQWKLGAKSMPLDVIEQIESLQLKSQGGRGDLSILFTLLDEDVAIQYDERHFLELRALVGVAGPARP